MLIQNFEKTFPPRELKPPAWNITCFSWIFLSSLWAHETVFGQAADFPGLIHTILPAVTVYFLHWESEEMC